MDLEYEEELIEKENKKQEPQTSSSKQMKQAQVTVNKEKLISNGPVVDNENVVTYKDGMTISDLAKALGVQSSDLIKKLFMLGVLATVNNKVDFDNAELLVSEYGKELKREQIIDETKFEEFEMNDKEEDLV